MPRPETRQFLQEILHFLSILHVSEAAYDRGLDIADRYKFALYDSIIVAAALISGCDTVWSEDFKHGQVIDGS